MSDQTQHRLLKFPAEVKFCHPWRPYQERILAELEKYLDDRHFHVAAAPGSGKTVLGLEVTRRLNFPALILTPNLGIRDQWLQRFLELFLPADTRGTRPAWVCNDLEKPGLLTVSTYQALYAYCRKHPVSFLVKRLEKAGINTLVFDEAHHLRQEWWKTLSHVKKTFKNPFVVALTATPPYDAAQVEWNRYAAMCGPVDAEVSIPELVMAGNLCPHQDYIYFVQSPKDIQRELDGFTNHMESFLRDLSLNREIIAAVQDHPVIKAPEKHIHMILKKHEYYLSLAVFLRHAFGVVSREMLKKMKLHGLKLPVFNPVWGEVLLQGILFHDRESFSAHEAAVKKVEALLYTYKAIENKKVYLRMTPRSHRLLRSSPAKLKGIADIVEMESRHCGFGLKMVILTDYIRENDFPSLHHEAKPFTKLGVVPIFDHLRRLRLPNVLLGSLTGSLVVIPRQVEPHMRNIAETLGLEPEQFKTRELWHDPAYLRIESRGRDQSRILEIMTRLFTSGFINVLVGTAALLGEGWDAPAVNTLVLATVVSSYISSNQMRGRAIRVDPEVSCKTANIWHLVCAGRGMEFSGETGIDDLSLLSRRFRAFPGVSIDSPAIENGLERLGINPKTFDSKAIDTLNARMCRLAEAREALHHQWKNALYHPDSSHRRMTREVFFPMLRVYSQKIAGYLLPAAHAPDSESSLFTRWVKWFLKLFLPYYQYRQLKRTAKIARALLFSLQESGILHTPLEDIQLKMIKGGHHIRAMAVGMNNREETIFIQSLQEIFYPLWSPRYVMKTRQGVYCVPQLLGANKQKALCFLHHWKKQVGCARLIFTQYVKGRQLLLKTVQQYLAAKSEYAAHSRVRWC